MSTECLAILTYITHSLCMILIWFSFKKYYRFNKVSSWKKWLSIFYKNVSIFRMSHNISVICTLDVCFQNLQSVIESEDCLNHNFFFKYSIYLTQMYRSELSSVECQLWKYGFAFDYSKFWSQHYWNVARITWFLDL